MNSKQRIAALATVLASHTDGSTEQLKMVALFVDDYQTTDSERELELVNALHDGLAYGNWPWVIAKMSKK
jgi:hypothetical protein